MKNVSDNLEYYKTLFLKTFQKTSKRVIWKHEYICLNAEEILEPRTLKLRN